MGDHGLAVREGVAQLEGIAVGDDDDVSTSRVLRDDMLDIDLVQRSGLHHAGERDQREQRVVIAGASELAKLGSGHWPCVRPPREACQHRPEQTA